MAASTRNLTKTCKNALKYNVLSRWLKIPVHRQFHTTENVYKTKAAIRLKHYQRTERLLQRVAEQVEGKTSFAKPKRKIDAGANPAITQIISHGFRKQGDQLGRIYSSHISEILESGQVSPELMELGFCITEVNLRLDRNELRISWAVIEPEKDNQIEPLLDGCAKDLSEALLAIPGMGVVPKIKLIKNNTGRHQDIVEEILKVADFGPDFMPTDAAAPFRTTPPEKNFSPVELKRNLAQVAKTFTGTVYESIEGPGGSHEVLDSKIDKSAMDQLEELSRSTYPDEHLPDEFSDLNLRSDVYDVKHNDIMKQIAHTKKRLARLKMHPVEPLQDPPGVKPQTITIANDPELMSKVLGQYRRSVGSKSRKRKLVEKRAQGKRNLSIDNVDTIL